MKKTILLCSLLLTTHCTFNESTPQPFVSEEPPIHSYSSPQAKKLIDGGALLVDVRSPDEYALGHLEGAVNIPYFQIKNMISKYETDKTHPIVLYCHTGRRAELARQDLQELGFTNVTNGGGIGELE